MPTAGVHTTVDGIPIHVRPIRPDDRHHLVAGMARLSPHSRYLRFLNAVDELTEEQLELFTQPDGVNHVAYIVLRPGPASEEAIATGRYLRLADQPDVAEFALTVADGFQGKGIGALLLRTLAAAARNNGVTRFHAAVHPDNTAMLSMIRAFGGEARFDSEEGVMTVNLDVTLVAPPGDTPRHAPRGDPPRQPRAEPTP